MVVTGRQRARRRPTKESWAEHVRSAISVLCTAANRIFGVGDTRANDNSVCRATIRTDMGSRRILPYSSGAKWYSRNTNQRLFSEYSPRFHRAPNTATRGAQPSQGRGRAEIVVEPEPGTAV